MVFLEGFSFGRQVGQLGEHLVPRLVVQDFDVVKSKQLQELFVLDCLGLSIGVDESLEVWPAWRREGRRDEDDGVGLLDYVATEVKSERLECLALVGFEVDILARQVSEDVRDYQCEIGSGVSSED